MTLLGVMFAVSVACWVGLAIVCFAGLMFDTDESAEREAA